MSTASSIGIVGKDGSKFRIYCHWDGYVEHNGVILQLAYSREEDVRKLMMLGNLSSLGCYMEPKAGIPHTFYEPQENVCVAYCRDRGEAFAMHDDADDYYDVDYRYTYDCNSHAWIVEKLNWEYNTEACKLLGTSIGSVNRQLLLDAIIEANKDGHIDNMWATDEFAEAGHVVEKCIQNAKAEVARWEDSKFSA